MSEFNLRQLIREVLRSSTMADPGDVATEVMRRIPARMIKTALTQVLRDVVRQVMSEERGKNSGAATVVETPPPPALRIAQPTLDDESSTPPPKPVPNRSWKRQAISDGWQKRLTDRIHVGQNARDWKLLRACTYEDLLFAATERRSLADSNAAVARQYDAWARLMNEHDVATFGDLPAEALMSALGRAA
jgi:hypothetical protein